MAIAYAPYIENIIPAFGYATSPNLIKLIIPFQDNMAVSKDSVVDYYAKIVDLNNILVWQGGGGHQENNTIIFTGTFGEKLLKNSYYKIQIAYRDNNQEYPSAYSTTATTKYLGQLPTLQFTTDSNIYKKTICYTLEENSSQEEPYSCLLLASNGRSKELFFKRDQEGKIIKDITILNFLNQNDVYYDTFIVTTVNGYQLQITSKDLPKPTEQFSPPTLKQNNHSIVLNKKDSIFLKKLDNGYYPIPQTDIFIEAGEQYDYAAIKNDCSSAISSLVRSPIIDYDSILLTSGKTSDNIGNNIPMKTLNIQYNSKISSFKVNLEEQKTNTIGGQYPIFYKNGNLKYKEIPISGLISYHMDDEGFVSETELGINTPSTDLTVQNIAAERKFRLKVLEWLTNGEVKLFRSPTEGMYLVRLMNVSLSPETKLGRMLYTFSCTAYEVAEISYDNLIKYGFMDEIAGVDYVVE